MSNKLVLSKASKFLKRFAIMGAIFITFGSGISTNVIYAHLQPQMLDTLRQTEVEQPEPPISLEDYVALASSGLFIGQAATYPDIQEWWYQNFGGGDFGGLGWDLRRVNGEIREIGDEYWRGLVDVWVEAIAYMAYQFEYTGSISDDAAYSARLQWHMLYGLDTPPTDSDPRLTNIDIVIEKAEEIINWYTEEDSLGYGLAPEGFLAKAEEVILILYQIRDATEQGVIATIYRSRAESFEDALVLGGYGENDDQNDAVPTNTPNQISLQPTATLSPTLAN